MNFQHGVCTVTDCIEHEYNGNCKLNKHICCHYVSKFSSDKDHMKNTSFWKH